MKEQRLSVALIVFLVIGGVLTVGVRSEVRDRRKVARGDEVWRLRYQLQLQANDDGARLRVSLPDDLDRNRVIGLNIDHPRLQGTMPRRASGFDRQLECRVGHSGNFSVRAEIDVHVRPQAAWRDAAKTRRLTPEERQRYLTSSPTISLAPESLKATLDSLSSEDSTPEELTAKVFAFCRDRLKRGSLETVPKVLARQSASPLGRARTMVALCRVAQIPARLVVGLDLEATPRAKAQVWVEVLLRETWTPYDPSAGFSGTLPPTRVILRRGGSKIVEASKGDTVSALFEVQRGRAPPGLLAPDQAHWTEILDLSRLPLPLQRLLATLLLLPFGAVIIGVFRNLIGLRTFGTFAPVLLALAFVYSDVTSGLLVLVIILGGGLAIRHVLDSLKLLMVARLGVVLTVIVTSLVLGISAVEFYSTAPNPQAVILPLVILTGLVEQIYITGEEDSLGYVFKLSAGTTLVAFCCYGVLSHVALGRLVLRYPELHLFTMAALIMIGRYAGYRLTELWRFHDLVRRPAPAETQATPAGATGEPAEPAAEAAEGGGPAPVGEQALSETSPSPSEADAPQGDAALPSAEEPAEPAGSDEPREGE